MGAGRLSIHTEDGVSHKKVITRFRINVCFALLLGSCTQNGSLIEYSDDGKTIKAKFAIISIDDSTYVKHGKFQIHHENHKLFAEGWYAYGLESGEEIIYNTHGTKVMQTQYLNGKENGTTRMWDDEGRLMFEIQMTNGKKNGTYRHWDNNGVLVEEKAYLNDTAHGLFSTWDRDGKLIKLYKYNLDKIVESTTWDQDGNKRHTIYDSAGDPTDEAWFDAVIFNRSDRTQFDSASASIDRNKRYFRLYY